MFESGIFSKLKQSEQSEQPEQSSTDDKYTSSKWNHDLITSNNTSNDSDIPLFT